MIGMQLKAALIRSFPDFAFNEILSEASNDTQLKPATKPEFGDFQANVALPLAKPIKQNPRQIALAIVVASSIFSHAMLFKAPCGLI